MACTIVSTIIFFALCIIEPFWRRRFPMVAVTADKQLEDERFALDAIAAELNEVSPPIEPPTSPTSKDSPSDKENEE